MSDNIYTIKDRILATVQRLHDNDDTLSSEDIQEYHDFITSSFIRIQRTELPENVTTEQFNEIVHNNHLNTVRETFFSRYGV